MIWMCRSHVTRSLNCLDLYKRVFEVASECHRDADEKKSWALHLLLAGLSIHKRGNMMQMATNFMYFYGDSRIAGTWLAAEKVMWGSWMQLAVDISVAALSVNSCTCCLLKWYDIIRIDHVFTSPSRSTHGFSCRRWRMNRFKGLRGNMLSRASDFLQDQDRMAWRCLLFVVWRGPAQT